MRHARPPVRLAAALLSLFLAAPLAAQSVSGTLVEEGSRAPVARAMVALVDSAGRVVASTQTRGDGRFELRAPGAGTFRVRAERVGRAASVSEPLALAAGETRPLELVARAQAVLLEGIVAQAEQRACSVRPDGEARVATVWEEARKALASVEWTRRNEPRVFEVKRFTRELDPRTLHVRHVRERAALTRHSTPFRAVPAEELAEKGFVQTDSASTVFLAPDAEVLLSDTFLDTHCFRLANGAAEDGTRLLGLAFEPVRGRRLPDVKGVLWLDAATAELRRVDYEYTGIPVQGQTWGGRLEFARIPDGAWIVRSWSIRMPVVGTRREVGTSLLARQAHERGLVAVQEEGAEVTGVRADDGQVVMDAPPPAGAALAGTVWDSTRARPLAGARVFLQGTPYETRTDSAGAFRLAAVPEGRYSVTFEHPRADTLVRVPEPVAVELKVGSDAEVRLALGRPPRQVARASASADSAIALAGVEATAEMRRRRLETVGFYTRKRTVSGTFIDEEQFKRRSGARLVDRLQGIRGFFARPSGPNGHAFYQYRQGRNCWVPFYLNGRLYPVSALLQVTVDDVEAVEVYDGHETPREFRQRAGQVCGAIVVWLKTPAFVP